LVCDDRETVLNSHLARAVPRHRLRILRLSVDEIEKKPEQMLEKGRRDRENTSGTAMKVV